jgi:cellulose synthase/poly-beta-1,6-N-acetylglucosamine synthase-like glycosyltransferase
MGQPLPSPPSDIEKHSYLNTSRWFLYCFGIASYLLLCLGMWLFAMAHTGFLWFGVFSLLVTIYLGISYALGVMGRDFNFAMHEIFVSGLGWEKSVDVYLPCAGEDISLLRNTYEYVSKLDWKDLRVWVLDDSGREEVRCAANNYGFEYISREDRGVLKKAGNLRNAFTQTSGEFIAIFDADFCPRPDFLKETMPYMYADEGIAIVQTPQFFSISDGQSWVEKGAGYIQELFYRLVQVNRDTFNAAICVGTCAVYRRSALEPFGGTAAIGYSEDVHTGFNVMSSGWRVKYLPVNLSKGVCPDTLAQFFNQQYRWAMGSITLFLNAQFWKSRLNVIQKICFLSGMLYYICTGIGVFLTPLPSMMLIVFAPEYVFWFNAFFSLPSFIFGLVFMGMWTQLKFGWYGPRVRVVSYYAHLFALVDKLRGNLMPWAVTGEKTKGGNRFVLFKSLMFYWVSLSSAVIIVGAAVQSVDYGVVNFIPAVFFAVYNYWIGMTILRDQE